MAKANKKKAKAKPPHRAIQLTFKPDKKTGPVHQWILVQRPKRMVLSESGDKEQSYNGQIPMKPTGFEIHAIGVPGAQFDLSVDLPGNVNDFTLKCRLPNTYLLVEFEV